MEHYYPRVDRLLTERPETSKGVLFVTRRSCPPIHNIQGVTRPECASLIENALSLAGDPKVDTVVIAAAWTRYAFEFEQHERLFQDLAATISCFRKMGRKVFVILPIPRGEPFDPAHLVKRSIRNFGFVVQERVERADVDKTLKPIAARLMDISRSSGATAIDPIDYICGEAYCPTLADDHMPVYTDESHLRPAFVRDHITFLDAILSTS